MAFRTAGIASCSGCSSRQSVPQTPAASFSAKSGLRATQSPRPCMPCPAICSFPGTFSSRSRCTSGWYRSGRSSRVSVRAESHNGEPRKSTQFGYSRKDVILIGGGLIGLGYAMYYGLQAAGVEAGFAGNVVQLAIFMGICVGYISTYIFRVANKEMTYVKQLEDYEEAVMSKRLAEMPEEEVERLMKEVEEEGPLREDRRRRFLEAQEEGTAPKP